MPSPRHRRSSSLTDPPADRMTLASRFVLKALDRFSVGCLTMRLPDGSTRVFGGEGSGPSADIEVKDWRFFRHILLDGDIGFAEAYMEGFCDSPDLPGLIALLAENEKALGGFAETAARRGMRVTGVTISSKQLEFARARLERAGLADRVDLQFRDYRDIEGCYDHIVSIEMVEAVGERYWPDYFATLKRHVAPGGSALVQAIVIADELFDGYRRHPDFIQTYVFPGGMLLSPASLREQCRQAGLKIAALYKFRPGHSRTPATPLGPFRTVPRH